MMFQIAKEHRLVDILGRVELSVIFKMNCELNSYILFEPIFYFLEIGKRK